MERRRNGLRLLLVLDLVLLVAGGVGARAVSDHTRSSEAMPTIPTAMTAPPPTDLRDAVVDLRGVDGLDCCGKLASPAVTDAAVYYHPCAALSLPVARWGSAAYIQAVENCTAAIPADPTVFTLLPRLGFTRVAQGMWETRDEDLVAVAGVLEFRSERSAQRWIEARRRNRLGNPKPFATHLPNAFGVTFTYVETLRLFQADGTTAVSQSSMELRRIEFAKGPRCYFVSLQSREKGRAAPDAVVELARLQYRL